MVVIIISIVVTTTMMVNDTKMVNGIMMVVGSIVMVNNTDIALHAISLDKALRSVMLSLISYPFFI